MAYLKVLLLLLLSLSASAHVDYLSIPRLRQGGWMLSSKSLNEKEFVPEAYKVLFKLDVNVVVMVKEWVEWSMLWKFYIITCSHVHRMFCGFSLANYDYS